MADENLNQIVIEANLGATQLNMAFANENARLMGEYMVLSVEESQYSVVYLAFGQANFHLRLMLSKCFKKRYNFWESHKKFQCS